ncbi:hypothetical protein ACEWY4_016798 [Coilia grayii]|uniref:Transposase n=1 Tax=Coilia grayii TaxID=363190 RepID=A0ABD1JMU9_9TELE
MIREDENAIINISVSFDGTWQKRGFTSHYGIGVCIDILTGLVVDFEVLSSYCHTCTLRECARRDGKCTQEEFEEWRETHVDCVKNFSGSSKAMEQEVAKRMWGRSVYRHQLRYTEMLSDGDSAAFKEVVALNPYPGHVKVVKLECINHVHKRMGTALRKLCAEQRFSVQRALEVLGLLDGDNSDLDLSDNDDPILDENYQPPPEEQSSSEDEGDSSDEDPIPEPTEHSRGRRGIRWKVTPLTPNPAEYQHQDETDLDRHGWTPLDYFEQYIDRDLMVLISECSNVMSLSKTGDPLNMSVDEVYHFFGACILMSCIRYPTIRMYWSKALKITAITDKFTRARFFKLRGAIKVVIDDDVPEDLRTLDKFWKVRPFLDRILQGCKSLNRPDCASIDEQMIPFTGACPYRQYLPMKPNPVGIKNFVCATADGIVLDFELYQGTNALIEKVEEPEGLGLGSLVIERLCQTLHPGTKVYCDRFFTTIKGAQRMMEKKLYMTVDLAEKISNALSETGVKNLIQLSMDGPHVNWKAFSLLQKEIQKQVDKLLLNIGSCGLHILHNAFREGCKTTGWDIEHTLSSLYWLFHDCPARHEDFVTATGCSTVMLKFCKHRWLENVTVTGRALKLWPRPDLRREGTSRQTSGSKDQVF